MSSPSPGKLEGPDGAIKLENNNKKDPPIYGNTNDGRTPTPTAKPKRTSLACIRCRTRHIRCPGGNPCKKCQLAKTKCEYVEADKKIVVSMKYLSKLHDDIARLKKENATLRNNLKLEEAKKVNSTPSVQEHQTQANPFASNTRFNPQYPHHEPSPSNSESPNEISNNEVIYPTLDKYGRLIQSRTGEKLYVGSSSMTLFGLEIQNMAPSFTSPNSFPDSKTGTPESSPNSQRSSITLQNTDSGLASHKRETEILEKEGNAYKITLAKTNTRPGLSLNFTLPAYSYAMLLVDTFVNYNDGCFYFFNEGLVKRYLMNLYSGKSEENKRIIRRNITENKGPAMDENSIKKDTDDDTILETIWFCKILLIFAIGEMYLGTESDTHVKALKLFEKSRLQSKKNKEKEKHEKRNTLPGSGFFYQASELFTGLFASGAIDNITKDGGIEVMLLYAFYLQVADCTIASYFYFGLALRSTLILGWHVDADKENLNRFELEHRRRIWWTVYMYERMLSSKAGLPLSFADDSISTELPIDFDMSLLNLPQDHSDVRAYYIFPPAEYINNCVTITQINAIILSSLYTKQPTVNILPVVTDLVHKLISWKNSLPEFLKVDFSLENLHISRLTVNLMTEYFQGMNLAVRPLLFHFATKKLKELQSQLTSNKYVDLTKYSKNVLTLLNASFQASINTIKAIWALLPENMVALFGWMDREYLFTSASTLILFNASFGVHEATKIHIDHALTIFTRMKKLGNYPAALRRAQLLKLVKVLDFNGVMTDLLIKHDDEMTKEAGISSTGDFVSHINQVNSISNSNIAPQHMAVLDSELATNPSVARSNLSNNEFDFMPFHNSLQNLSNHDLPNQLNTNIGSGSTSFNFDTPMSSNLQPVGDIYSNSDLAGIEGLTYLDEEQKLWNEITNDAVWLNVAGGNPNHVSSTNFNQNDFLKKYQTHRNNYSTDRSNNSSFQPDTQEFHNTNSLYDSVLPVSNGGYSDIINQEFQDFMEE